MARAYLIFHLNLAFSSIPEAARQQVIDKCYWPLLELIDSSGIPIGVEMTGWTLKQIEHLSPRWIDHFRLSLRKGNCELIGSGWSQIIGPLIPYSVNVQNLRLGMQAYNETLDSHPGIALINEMAFSNSMVDLYHAAGYRGIIMDRDNIRLALGLEDRPLSEVPTHALGCNDNALPVLWSDSILFQRLQRAVHGDITLDEYFRYVGSRIASDGHDSILPIYCNDAEIFDYRPGRFSSEPRLHHESEWSRLQRILSRLTNELDISWLSPSSALDIHIQSHTSNIGRLTSASQPIPVKKQPKYNICRWAVTGRNDLWVNTLCHHMYRKLENSENASDKDWRSLCEFWASDYRTHITDDRWQTLLSKLVSHQVNADPVIDPPVINSSLSNRSRILTDPEGIFLEILTPDVRLVLNRRRGMAIHELAFAQHHFKPILGTLNQGYFSTIKMAADFYSGGVIIDIPGERQRLTDLEWVDPLVWEDGDWLRIRCSMPFGSGFLIKQFSLHLGEARLQLSYFFEGIDRPLGVVRVGLLTFFTDLMEQPLRLFCHNGGPQFEVFVLDEATDHGQPVSTLVSSQGGLGATQGVLMVCGNDGRGAAFSWRPDSCAAMPMLTHQDFHGKHFTRLCFSLCELDDTSRPGGYLLPFSFDITPLS